MTKFEIIVGDTGDVMFRTDDRQDAMQWFIVWACRFGGYVALRTDGVIERVRARKPDMNFADYELEVDADQAII